MRWRVRDFHLNPLVPGGTYRFPELFLLGNRDAGSGSRDNHTFGRMIDLFEIRKRAEGGGSYGS